MSIYVLIPLLGLCFGSFISALTYRYPKNISFVGGRSFCPKCKHQISWFDNIPLLSFLILGGKCRNCKKPISLRYPAIELLSASGFLFFYINRNIIPYNIYFFLLIFIILTAIFVIDFENQIIPDDFVFLGIILVFLYLILNVQYAILFPSLFAGFFAALLLLLIHLLTRGRGMGLGDVKFAVLGGFLVGLNLTGVWLLASFLTGGIVGIILILERRAGLKDKIAFGPFLIIGLVVALLWGEKILLLLSSS